MVSFFHYWCGVGWKMDWSPFSFIFICSHLQKQFKMHSRRCGCGGNSLNDCGSLVTQNVRLLTLSCSDNNEDWSLAEGTVCTWKNVHLALTAQRTETPENTSKHFNSTCSAFREKCCATVRQKKKSLWLSVPWKPLRWASGPPYIQLFVLSHCVGVVGCVHVSVSNTKQLQCRKIHLIWDLFAKPQFTRQWNSGTTNLCSVARYT